MLRTFTLSLLLLIGNICQARAPLAPQTPVPLIRHLSEVNAFWQDRLPELATLSTATFSHDDQRIQLHLQYVEARLRAHPPAGLTAAQRQRRKHQLDVLHAYWQRGQFPRNTAHPNRRPYFVDRYGTACAVGYLLLADGQQELVGRIRQHHNTGYLQQLAELYPEIGPWAQHHGFTTDELAWIQPAYPPQPRPFGPLGQNLGVAGRVNVLLTDPQGQYLYAGGSFSAIDGVPANNMARWDGESWTALGNGVEGEVLAMTFVGDRLYVGGRFSLPGLPNRQNLAYWNGVQWTGPQDGDMQGQVYALAAFDDHLYVGGDFQRADGQLLPYLFRMDPATGQATQTGRYYLPEWGSVDVAGALAVDGPVHALAQVGPHLLVGGEFTQVATLADPIYLTPQAANQLAYLNTQSNWVGEVGGWAHGAVRRMHYDQQGELYVSGEQEGAFTPIYRLRGGLWEMGAAVEHADSVGVYQFVEAQGFVFALGHFMTNTIFIYGDGLCTLDDENNVGFPVALFGNQPVRAGAVYRNELILTGDFTQVNNLALQQFARLPLAPTSTSPQPDAAEPWRAWINTGTLWAAGPAGSLAPVAAELFNLAGQRMWQGSPTNGGNLCQWLLPGGLPSGAYFCRLRWADGQTQTVKLVTAVP